MFDVNVLLGNLSISCVSKYSFISFCISADLSVCLCLSVSLSLSLGRYLSTVYREYALPVPTALHCAPRLARVLLAIRSAVSCCHARECKGAPREAVARAKAFRETPSRCGSRHAAPSTRMRSHVRVWVQVNLLPPGSASHRAHRQGSLPSRARPCRQLGVAREYADTPPIHTTHTRIL